MKQRHWIVPALLALPFAVAVSYDLYRAGSASDVEAMDLLAGGAEGLIFVSSDLVLNLRAKPPNPEPGHRVTPNFDAGWGEATPQGRWTVGNRAVLSWTSATDRQRALFLEARVSRTTEPAPRLLVAVNGRSCGVVKVTEKMDVYLVEFEAGQIRVGDNTLELKLLSQASPAGVAGRNVLLRRIGFAADTTGGFPTPSKRPPLLVNPDARSIVVCRPGRLILPFKVSAGGSSLSLRYRFRDPEPNSEARVVVGRRYVSPDRFDAMREWTLRPDQKVAGRLRQTLRDRGETGVLFVDVNSAAADGGFVLRDPLLEVVP